MNSNGKYDGNGNGDNKYIIENQQNRNSDKKNSFNNNVLSNNYVESICSYFRFVNAPEIRWSIFVFAEFIRLFIFYLFTLMLENGSYIDLIQSFGECLLLR